MLTIFGRKSSANVQKVHWICLEVNLEFKAINIGGKYGLYLIKKVIIIHHTITALQA